MKVRVKLAGSSRGVDVGDVEQCTLLQLQERTAEAFQLSETPFSLSLNKKDTLTGEDLTLSQLGIVAGDLIFVLCQDPSLPNNHNNSTPSSNTTTPSPSISSSSCSNRDVAQGTDGADSGHVICTEGGTIGRIETDQQTVEPVSQIVSEGKSVGDEEDLAAATTSSSEPMSPCPLEDPEVNRCLQEPLLCRESTPNCVPALLRDLFSRAACRGATDAVWVVVHTLMLEVGFRPRQDEDFSLGSGWNSHGFYKQEYRHLCVNAEHSCSLIGVPMGQMISVHGVTSGNPQLKTEPQTLKVTDYVQDNNVNQDVCNVYKNLDRLSRIVKDLICQRLMSQLSEVCGFPLTLGLLSLSYELKLKVLSYLPASSVSKVGQACRDLNVTYRDPWLWRRLYLREFGQNGDNSLNKNWYQLYKDAYQWRKERRRLSRHRQQQMMMHIPPWLNPPPSHFSPLVPPPFTGGILGGDYDLNPEFASSIPHPLGGQPQGPNPFLPQAPGAPFLPRPRFDDPFGPGASPGNPFMTLGGAGSRNSRTSPFSSQGGHRFF
ncbi:F-box only protein 7-like [Babylonia areolata]|uniref:F-box only protein 7-like n=1 Tax=Babylonia areolata TaxID=304850 RepID=UPI003FD6AA5B